MKGNICKMLTGTWQHSFERKSNKRVFIFARWKAIDIRLFTRQFLLLLRSACRKRIASL